MLLGAALIDRLAPTGAEGRRRFDFVRFRTHNNFYPDASLYRHIRPILMCQLPRALYAIGGPMTATQGHILCIDNHASRNLAVFLLEQAHYEVITAGSVPDAVELAQSEHFDLFLINHQLAEGTGAVACDKLSEVAPDTPILPYSTVTYPYRDRPPIRYGAHANPLKPVDVTEVATGVCRAIKRQRGLVNNAS